MSWLAFAALAALIYGLVELLDKYVLDNEVKDAFLSALFCKLPIFIIFVLAGYIYGNFVLSYRMAGVSFFLVMVYIISSYSYYSGIEKEDVSRFIPTLSVNGIFVVLISFMFLGESFSLQVYGGIAAVIAGSFLISLENPGKRDIHHFESTQAIFLAIVAAFLWAVRDVFLKFLTSETQIFSVLLWIGLIGIPVTLLLILYKRKELEKEGLRGFEHLFLIGVLVGIGYLVFLEAVDKGPVSLVSTVVKLDAVFVFFGSAIATAVSPTSFHEQIDSKTLLQKIVSILLILAGVALINL